MDAFQKGNSLYVVDDDKYKRCNLNLSNFEVTTHDWSMDEKMEHLTVRVYKTFTDFEKGKTAHVFRFAQANQDQAKAPCSLQVEKPVQR